MLVLFGDVPLIRAETMTQIIEQVGDSAVCILSFEPENPFNYGRIVRRQDGSVRAIVEHKDASQEQLGIGECFSGIMAIRSDRLRRLVIPPRAVAERP